MHALREVGAEEVAAAQIIAMIRGPLLDVPATGDVDRVEAAFGFYQASLRGRGVQRAD